MIETTCPRCWREYEHSPWPGPRCQCPIVVTITTDTATPLPTVETTREADRASRYLQGD